MEPASMTLQALTAELRGLAREQRRIDERRDLLLDESKRRQDALLLSMPWLDDAPRPQKKRRSA